MRIPLTSGAYQSRSVISEAQRCVNLYAESNPQDAPCPFTYYPTPGLSLVSTPPIVGECRCIYTASNGARYDVVKNKVYAVSQSNSYSLIGSLQSTSGPVSMADNGIDVFVVDGTTYGFTINLKSGIFSPVSDSSFYGADKVDFVDGFFIFNRPGTRQFYISQNNDITFDALDVASKSTYADNLVTLAVMHRDIWLFGDATTEVWYNTGASDFTFGRMPGVFIEHGCAAKHSVAKMDLVLFWLGKDLQGQCIIFAGKNYTAEKISTHAIENAISGYSRVDDAIGFTYMQNGHGFYMLSFPTANVTWCYDVVTQQWHQRAFLQQDGVLGRHRANCHSFNAGRNLVGDWQTGKVYMLDQSAYTDNGATIEYIRGFPHVIGGDGNRVMFRQFIADMEVGSGLPSDSAEPEIRLRWSDDRGRSWGNWVVASLGKVGEYLTSVQFQRLGYARDRVFELSWSAPIKTALNGAFIDVSRART